MLQLRMTTTRLRMGRMVDLEMISMILKKGRKMLNLVISMMVFKSQHQLPVHHNLFLSFPHFQSWTFQISIRQKRSKQQQSHT